MTNTAHLTELGHSPDALAQRQADLLALLRQTAPEVLSDNQINIEKLKELLGQERIAPAEHYELNWAGKTEARREIQKTSSHTLRPDANNPASAQHMLIVRLPLNFGALSPGFMRRSCAEPPASVARIAWG